MAAPSCMSQAFPSQRTIGSCLNYLHMQYTSVLSPTNTLNIFLSSTQACSFMALLLFPAQQFSHSPPPQYLRSPKTLANKY